MPTTTLAIPLTAHPLRFTVQVEKTIALHAFAGSALRGALAGQLRRLFCPEWRSDQTDPIHRSLCPVCQILSWEGDESTSGDLRRPYTLQAPLDSRQVYEAGEYLHFGITIFGDKLVLLPYFILAIQAMGAQGMGRRDTQGRRGTFQLHTVDAIHPFTGEALTMLALGGQSVTTQTLPVHHADIMAQATVLSTRLQVNQNQLRVNWLTPVRLTQGRALIKTAEFFPFMKQTVLRILDLCAQHGDGRPDIVLREDIFPLADSVTLVDSQTRWWDVQGYSGRLNQRQVLGGLMGTATYRAPDWSALLPWLLWGEVAQVGKNVVKGCGRYRLEVASVSSKLE